VVFGGEAQDGAAPLKASSSSEPKAVTTDAIFDEIMLSLPGDARARVDSASDTQRNVGTDNAVGGAGERDSTSKNAADSQLAPLEGALEDLPDELRLKVEKAIQEMDNRSMERRGEFMEHKRKTKRSR
jgi:hypothetical protein